MPFDDALAHNALTLACCIISFMTTLTPYSSGYVSPSWLAFPLLRPLLQRLREQVGSEERRLCATSPDVRARDGEPVYCNGLCGLRDRF